MPKAFSEREKEIIRARLLENGARAFATYGLRRTNIEDLTQSIGISKGAFYLFYESKEALFMDVAEEAERTFRQRVLDEIEKPGPSPRARLLHVFRTAFSIWRSMPILKLLSTAEYQLLLEKMPVDKIQEHLQSDREFIEVLIRSCREAGIPMKPEVEQVAGLMNAMFFVSLHEQDFGPNVYPGTVDLLLDLVAAFCVGEIV